jgi:hypothetical protein
MSPSPIGGGDGLGARDRKRQTFGARLQVLDIERRRRQSLEHPCPDRLQHRMRAVAGLELAKNVRQMILHRAIGDVQ